MSSPKVLTWVTMPHEDAVAGNLASMEHYLDLARELHRQTMEVQQRSAALSEAAGAHTPAGPLMDPQAAAASARQRFEQSRSAYDAGMQGVEFAHAYWQSLKHPWHELVLRQHAELRAEADERAALERQRLSQVVQAVDSGVHVQMQAPAQRVQMTLRADALVHSWPERVQAMLAVLRAHAPPGDRDALERRVADTVALPPEPRWLALEALRLAQEQQAKAQRIAAALALFQAERRALRAERMQTRLAACAARLEHLASPRIDALNTEHEALQQRLDSPDLDEPDEDRLEALSRQVLQEQARLRLLNDAVVQLRAMGYVQVQVMQTLHPADVASAFLEDPRDPDRLALVQVSAQHGLMSAEIVRRSASDGSGPQRQADHGAQVRLCQALARAEAVLAERFGLQLHSEQPPGTPVQQARVALPARRDTARRAAAQRARHLG